MSSKPYNVKRGQDILCVVPQLNAMAHGFIFQKQH